MATRKKAATAATVTETKAEKFVRLARARVPRAMKAIESVGKLAASGYESTPDQREKVLQAIEGTVKALRQRYAGEKATATFDI